MITGRHYPTSREGLFEVVRNATADARVAVAQAGHFLLYQDEVTSRAVPCIESELADARYRAISREFGQFPSISWALAAALLDHLPLRERFLLVLVNDWQYVPDRDARDGFYTDHPRLPAAYRAAPPAFGRLLTPRGPADFSDADPFFSERVLRNQFHRRLKKLTGSASLPQGLELQHQQSGATCSLEVMGRMEEIYCSKKSADCSGEVAQLIDQAHTLVSCDTFINFVPNVCQTYVEIGSEIPSQIFGTGVERVINISLLATHVVDEQEMLSAACVTVHKI
jgi:hypothetical protein